MIDPFETPLNDFHQELHRIYGLAKIIDDLREFGRVTPPYASSDNEFLIKVRDLRQHIRERHTAFPVLSATLVMYLVGKFESFARANLEILCESIAAKCQKFEHLPEQMRKELKSCTAEVVSNPNKYGFKEHEVHNFIQRLSTNLFATDGLGDINSRCLSYTHENLRPGTLKDLYKRAGLLELWVKIGNHAVMQAYFDSEIAGSVQQHAMALLEDIITERNGLAHPRSDIIFPGTDKVITYAEFLEVLSKSLVEVSRQYLSEFKQNGI